MYRNKIRRCLQFFKNFSDVFISLKKIFEKLQLDENKLYWFIMYLRGTFATSVSRFLALLFFSRRKERIGCYFVFWWFETHVETGIGGAREFVETSLATEGVLRRHRSDCILLQHKTITFILILLHELKFYYHMIAHWKDFSRQPKRFFFKIYV